MIKNTIILLPFYLAACFGQSGHKEKAPDSTNNLVKETYAWKKILDSADWKKNYNFQMFNIKDTLWVFHPDGNWFSTNGSDWTKSILTNSINNLAFLDYVQFKDAVYGLGHFEGNIEHYQFEPVIYKTSDLKQWQTLAAQSNLPKRFFYHPFVFDNKLWIIGGEDSNQQYADIWNSSDGITWVKQKDNLPFGKRSQSKIILLNDTLYLLNNDVWISTDAINWTLWTKEIVKGQEIFGYAVEVLDNQIWLLGCNRNGRFSSQVLVSKDGKNWQAQDAPWTPRGAVASTVYKNKIFMTGGKYGGTPDQPDFKYSNDVWSFGKRE